MKVLLADKLAESVRSALEAAGHDVVAAAKASGDDLVAALAEHQPHVLVVRSTKVPAEAMDAARGLELIVRAGAGVDNIDMDAASARGIFVSNCPGKNAAAVAELAFGLILALDRRIPDNAAQFREGRWNKAEFSNAEGVKGKTLGLVGLGNIGQEMATRARAFGMDVVAWSRSLTPEKARQLGVDYAESPEAVARQADAISVHVAATPETRHLAGAAFFEAMKPGALFVNTARAAVVDERALRKAMDQKGVRAALDVFEGEPAGKDGDVHHPLALHPNLYVTHHIGASTTQASEETGAEAVRVVQAYHETGDAPNCVNLAERSPATHLLTVRHRDRVGVLASVLGVMRQAEWNVQEMENLIFEGAQAACARIRFDGAPSDATVADIEQQEHVLAVSLIAL